MINIHYREAALGAYGESCEICGHRTSLEVHHINYQEHQDAENAIRKAEKSKTIKSHLEMLIDYAKELGFDTYENGQLAKDDDTKNLSVLCGNCHSLIHTMDVGKKLLKALKPRR